MAEKPETFGQLLRRLRKENGDMSLRDLAGKLGVSFPYLSQIEADVAKPSEELVAKIAKLFNQDVEKLTFSARNVADQIREIKEKFPNVSMPFFRKALKDDK
ncbi:MAG: helix-turn-helix transcriptional regulator [Elusimicrobia bacterium]|nr:helix-turn-helix transcriptional regulator [Elusimicrobiota bacterium]